MESGERIKGRGRGRGVSKAAGLLGLSAPAWGARVYWCVRGLCRLAGWLRCRLALG
jgi:hypothetical protein